MWPATLLLTDSKEIREERNRACVLQVLADNESKIGDTIDITRLSTMGPANFVYVSFLSYAAIIHHSPV